MIHLLNNPLPYVPWETNTDQRRLFFYIDELVPVRDVVIRLNGMRVVGASLPLQEQELTVRADPATATIVVPEVRVQEVVLVQLADS